MDKSTIYVRNSLTKQLYTNRRKTKKILPVNNPKLQKNNQSMQQNNHTQSGAQQAISEFKNTRNTKKKRKTNLTETTHWQEGSQYLSEIYCLSQMHDDPYLQASPRPYPQTSLNESDGPSTNQRHGLVQNFESQRRYFQQKIVLLQVENRELNRKIQDLSQTFGKPSEHCQLHYTPSDSRMKSNVKSEWCEVKQNNQNNSLIIIDKDKKNNKSLHKASNDRNSGSSKLSSLLISLETSKISIKDNQAYNWTVNEADYLTKLEDDFTQLLDYIKEESNESRKNILRKMLAAKAKVLKKHQIF